MPDVPDVPGWIDELVQAVAEHIASSGAMGPLGVRFRELEGGLWEVVIHPTPIEVVGGSDDGAVVDPVFSIDLAALRSEFDDVDEIVVSSHGQYEDEDAFLAIGGEWSGRQILLRVLLRPPEDEPPGSKLKSNERE